MSPKDMPEELLQCVEFPSHIWWKGRGTEWRLGMFRAANLLPWVIAKASALREQVGAEFLPCQWHSKTSVLAPACWTCKEATVAEQRQG